VGLLLFGALPFGSLTRQKSCAMPCCRLGQPQASCQLQHPPLALALAVGGCDDKAPASAPSVPPSVFPNPIRLPDMAVSGPAAGAAILWPESVSPRLFDPPPRA
jgi:hypothetical protein